MPQPTIQAPERFDRKAAEDFVRETLDAVSAAPPGTTLVIDLSRTSYLSSAGVSALLSLYRECRGLGRNLALAAPPPGVKVVLELAGLERLMDILPHPPKER